MLRPQDTTRADQAARRHMELHARRRRGGRAQGWWRAALPDARRMPVPSSFNDILVDPRLHDHVGDVWYQRSAFVPRGWGGRRVVLRFDAATHRARVWIGRYPGRRARGWVHAVRGRRDLLGDTGRGVPAHRRRQQRAHVAVDPTGRGGNLPTGHGGNASTTTSSITPASTAASGCPRPHTPALTTSPW